MASCWLPSHIYMCLLSDGAVVLDLKRNRYSGIDRNVSLALLAHLRVDDPTERHQQTQLVSALISTGLLQREGPTPRWFDPASIDLRQPLATIEEVDADHEILRFSDMVRFGYHCLNTRRILHYSSLYDIAQRLRTTQSAAQRGDLEPRQLASLVNRFHRLRPYAFAAHDQCLFHALALVRFLASFGVAATWMIGVRLHPWGAHSWVQRDHWLLDATPEAVSEYTPIIAV